MAVRCSSVFDRCWAKWVLAGAALLPCAGCGLMAHEQNVEGVQYYQQGNLNAALDTFQKSIETDPQDADSYYNLGAAHHQLAKMRQNPADLQQAETYYQQCLAINPNHRDCRRGLAVLYVDEGRAADSFRMLQEWSDRAPQLADPKVELARLSEEFGDKTTAKTRLEEAVAISPTDPRALAALGKLREDSGDLDQAGANYARALQTNPNQPQVAARLSAIQQSRGGAAPWYTQTNGTRLVNNPTGPTYR
ncbi:MAG TPA: tetratricopeptide repeat protein [Pirellulales bacterium]|jgi:tetratricopeptide (TPR) repeat protein|nr:tetratricopeptide repeat protein [Pirellulales bacterium]